MRINFYGDSKGNLGRIGYGGIFHDEDHNILHIYVVDYGFTSNNVVEFLTLERSLKLSLSGSYFNIQIDVESQLVKLTTRKIINGALVEIFSKSWRHVHPISHI